MPSSWVFIRGNLPSCRSTPSHKPPAPAIPQVSRSDFDSYTVKWTQQGPQVHQLEYATMERNAPTGYSLMQEASCHHRIKQGADLDKQCMRTTHTAAMMRLLRHHLGREELHNSPACKGHTAPAMAIPGSMQAMLCRTVRYIRQCLTQSRTSDSPSMSGTTIGGDTAAPRRHPAACAPLCARACNLLCAVEASR